MVVGRDAPFLFPFLFPANFSLRRLFLFSLGTCAVWGRSSPPRLFDLVFIGFIYTEGMCPSPPPDRKLLTFPFSTRVNVDSPFPAVVSPLSFPLPLTVHDGGTKLTHSLWSAAPIDLMLSQISSFFLLISVSPVHPSPPPLPSRARLRGDFYD